MGKKEKQKANAVQLAKTICSTPQGLQAITSLCKRAPYQTQELLTYCIFIMSCYSESLYTVLVQLFTAEIQAANEQSVNTLFRETTFGTQMMKLSVIGLGKSYLQRTLNQGIEEIANSTDNDVIELNSNRVSEAELKRNLSKLRQYIDLLLHSIYQSWQDCPLLFRKLCEHLRKCIEKKFPAMKLADHKKGELDATSVMCSFIFLRFYVPSICDPVKYGIYTADVNLSLARNLVQCSKAMQNLANGSFFGEEKIPAFDDFNKYLKSHQQQLRNFIDKMANASGDEQSLKDILREYQLPKGAVEQAAGIVLSAIQLHAKELQEDLSKVAVAKVASFDPDLEQTVTDESSGDEAFTQASISNGNITGTSLLQRVLEEIPNCGNLPDFNAIDDWNLGDPLEFSAKHKSSANGSKEKEMKVQTRARVASDSDVVAEKMEKKSKEKGEKPSSNSVPFSIPLERMETETRQSNSPRRQSLVHAISSFSPRSSRRAKNVQNSATTSPTNISVIPSVGSVASEDLNGENIPQSSPKQMTMDSIRDLIQKTNETKKEYFEQIQIEREATKIAMARAIRAEEEVAELTVEMEQLKSKNVALEKRLADLEAQIQSLVKEKGKKESSKSMQEIKTPKSSNIPPVSGKVKSMTEKIESSTSPRSGMSENSEGKLNATSPRKQSEPITVPALNTSFGAYSSSAHSSPRGANSSSQYTSPRGGHRDSTKEQIHAAVNTWLSGRG